MGLWLDDAIGVQCRFESCNSGDDVPSRARIFAHHFESQGTPVMIGGGELAFTLLGVDFNAHTGEVRYLIMDPHYTGADDVALITPKWIGWKSADSLTHLGTKLFKSDAFYTFCLVRTSRAAHSRAPTAPAARARSPRPQARARRPAPAVCARARSPRPRPQPAARARLAMT